MQVTTTTFTIAQYATQMKDGTIVVNHEYQRTSKVWPPAARSYLIDTILLGFPIPKLSLYQRTDLRTRRTFHEIVDGQQRSEAIRDFFDDILRISGPSKFAGKRYSQLDESDQAKFVQYQLSVDLFVGATPEDIRETFRRINSYTVPLNKQETRHSTYQGEFKWFIVDLSRTYAQALKETGVFSESQLSRMSDGALFAEVVMAIEQGITSSSDVKIDSFYAKNDSSFSKSDEMRRRIDSAFEWVFRWKDIHKTSVVKPYNFYTLILAITHHLDPVPELNALCLVDTGNSFQEDIVLANLGTLAAAQDNPELYPKFRPFVDATSSATTRLNQRRTRFSFFCIALDAVLMR